jgi:hypothetical protein
VAKSAGPKRRTMSPSEGDGSCTGRGPYGSGSLPIASSGLRVAVTTRRWTWV